MSEQKLKSNQPLLGIWPWLRDQIVQTVPEDSEPCEFDCRKCQCTTGEWETCARRLCKGAGQSIPRHEKASPQ